MFTDRNGRNLTRLCRNSARVQRHVNIRENVVKYITISNIKNNNIILLCDLTYESFVYNTRAGLTENT